MSELQIPHIENVPEQDIADVASHNQEFLRSKYEGDVAQFRAELIQRMIGHNALHNTLGWLYYIEPQVDSGSVITDSQPKETLLLVLLNDADEDTKTPMPIVRILTNTEYRLPEETAFVAEDITIDSTGDSQLFIDVLIQNDDGVILAGLEEECKSYAPLFVVRPDGDLTFFNLEQTTPLMTVSHEGLSGDGELKKVKPFGNFRNLEDRITALDWAKQIVADTAHAELVAWHSPDSTE